MAGDLSAVTKLDQATAPTGAQPLAVGWGVPVVGTDNSTFRVSAWDKLDRAMVPVTPGSGASAFTLTLIGR